MSCKDRTFSWEGQEEQEPKFLVIVGKKTHNDMIRSVATRLSMLGISDRLESKAHDVLYEIGVRIDEKQIGARIEETTGRIFHEWQQRKFLYKQLEREDQSAPFVQFSSRGTGSAIFVDPRWIAFIRQQDQHTRIVFLQGLSVEVEESALDVAQKMKVR